MGKTAVIYLARGIDTPWQAYEDFFSSYRKFSADHEHDLIVLIKGWEDKSLLEKFKQMSADVTKDYLALPDDGFDWGAYFRATEKLDYDYFLFLNTHSEFLHPGWLKILHAGLEKTGVGAVGSTGSWESMLPSFNYMMGYYFHNAHTLRDMKRWLVNHIHFPLYPNPHLRSNAFLVPRKTMLAFSAKSKIPRKKQHAYRLESGFAGLTRFLLKRDTPPLIAGADGQFYMVQEWNVSRTFRQSDCSNLLIADNQTKDFAKRVGDEKALFMASTWNRRGVPRFSLYPLAKSWIGSLFRRALKKIKPI